MARYCNLFYEHHPPTHPHSESDSDVYLKSVHIWCFLVCTKLFIWNGICVRFSGHILPYRFGFPFYLQLNLLFSFELTFGSVFKCKFINVCVYFFPCQRVFNQLCCSGFFTFHVHTFNDFECNPEKLANSDSEMGFELRIHCIQTLGLIWPTW